jgi:hypothetical protein
MSNRFDEDAVKAKIASLTNAANLALCDQHTQDFQVRLLPDNSLAPARFKKILDYPPTYLAHPVTIRAVRPDLFTAGECLEDFAIVHCCFGCKQEIDIQFWKFCPFCERQFPRELLKKG